MTNTSGTMGDPQAGSDTAPLRAKSGWIIALGVVYLIAGFIALGSVVMATVASVLVVVLSTTAVVMLVSPRQIATRKYDVKPESTLPPVSPTAPWPKAVIDETEFDFGRMEVGDEQSHAFTIRNEGEAPLVIKQGPTTCQCTVSNVEKDQVAVGDSATITLKWKPTVQAEQFGKGAEIYTNDPKMTNIRLKILGMVAPRLVTYPEKTWASPDVLEGQPAVFNGTILSPVTDKFQVVALESKDPLLSAEAVPLEKEELEAKRGLAGYQIRVSVSPQVPIGAFALPLTIKTDLPVRLSDGTPGQGMEVEVLVTGHRRGPIRFIGGPEWDESSMAVVLGSIDTKAGKQVTVTMIVRGEGAEEFQLTEPPSCDPEDLRVTLARDEKTKGKQVRFQLAVEYPAGARPTTHRQDNPGKILLRTNLASAPKIELSVYLLAY
jgi:hypothetical protein